MCRVRISREDVRHGVVRDPAAVLDAGGGKSRDCRFRVPHAVRRRANAKPTHRLDQEFFQLGGALLVSPVADPDDIAAIRGWCMTGRRERREHARIGRLVPGPGALRPAQLEVAIAHGVAEREDAVVVAQIAGGQRLPVAHRAVVRVMEEEEVAAARRSVLTDARHHLGIGPLVDEDEIRSEERLVEIERRRIVQLAPKRWIRAVEVLDGREPVISNEIDPAPSVGRLEDADDRAARFQLARDAAQEVRVAVVPVRHERVAEDHDAHGTLAGAGRCASTERYTPR
jgi:hypothetical protein